VAASALVYPPTLDFLLRGLDSMANDYPWPEDLTSDEPERAVALRVGFRLIQYFERREVGPLGRL